jgi:hypothetical protein
MALSKKQLKDVCLMWGSSRQCRYLGEEDGGNGSMVDVCKKKSVYKDIIDGEIVEFLKEMKANGQDPMAQGVPLGNNCQGYIVLKSKEQGYDVKP